MQSLHYMTHEFTVTRRPISRQRPKYAHATTEKVWQELFSLWSAPCPFLGNGSLNTFPQKQTRGKIVDRLLGNGAVNRLCPQYRLCFPWGPCKVNIRESISEDGSCGRTRMKRERTRMEASLRKLFIVSCCN
jgi:hypothetical protein